MLDRKIFFILFTIFSFTGLAFADAAPEPGYVRIGVPLIIEPQDDFAGYRFFLDSPGGFEEIALARGKTTTISTSGRAGSMKFTSLIAIPVAGLTAYTAPLTPEKLDELQKTLGEKKIEGIIALVDHSFDEYIKKKERKSWRGPKYILKANAEKKIEVVTVKAAPRKIIRGEADTGDENSHLAATIAGGSLMSLAFIFGGVWFARRKKNVPA